MEDLHLKTIILTPKRARNGQMFLLVKQGKRVSFWFNRDWLRIKSSFQEVELSRNKRIQLEKVGHIIIVNVTNPINTYSIMLSPKEWNLLKNISQQIDAIFEKENILFYMWETRDQTSDHFFLTSDECQADANNKQADVNSLYICESSVKFPEKSTLIYFVFSWILHKQLTYMMDNEKTFHECFNIMRQQAYMYWLQTFRLCLKLNKKMKMMHIEFTECCLPFNATMKKEIKEGILFQQCPI